MRWRSYGKGKLKLFAGLQDSWFYQDDFIRQPGIRVSPSMRLPAMSQFDAIAFGLLINKQSHLTTDGFTTVVNPVTAIERDTDLTFRHPERSRDSGTHRRDGVAYYADHYRTVKTASRRSHLSRPV